MKGNSRQQGQIAEQQALRYLKQQGLKPVERNFHSRQGEIDLIMHQGGQLLFIEVRQRSNSKYGSASESVTPRKQQRIIHAANHYLQCNPKWNRHPCRFDVIAIDYRDDEQKIQWIQNAFQA